MLAQHGWRSRPSPRRGFTVVEASREVTGAPVVVAVHDSRQGIHLFRSAVDEAMGRHCNLVVLDYGDVSLLEELDDETSDIDSRERTTLRTLLSNPHVQVIRTDPAIFDLEKTVAYCETTGARLLIVGADHMGSANLDDRLSNRVFHGVFDVLVLTGNE